MAEYLLVSAPGEPTPSKTWDLINEKTSNLSINNKFSIPDLKVSHTEWWCGSIKYKKNDPLVGKLMLAVAQTLP